MFIAAILQDQQGFLNHNPADFTKKAVALEKFFLLFYEEVPLLLGRDELFNQFQIVFDERKGWVDFKERGAKRGKYTFANKRTKRPKPV